MKTRSRFVLACVALASTTLAFGAAWQPEGNRPASAGQPGEQPPGRGGGSGRPGGPGGARGVASVEAGMRGMNRALKQLRSQVTDAAKKDENLRLISDIQRSTVVAKSAPLPESVLKNAKDEAEKARLATDFRKRLIEIVRLGLDTEQDIMDGKGADAAKKLEQIVKLRDDGHAALGVKEEEDRESPRGRSGTPG